MDLQDCKRIGILGGTFNPIHIGHLLMAEHAKEEADLDVVMLMPTGRSYLKANAGVPAGEIRLEMVERSVSQNPGLLASDIEVVRGGNTYTYETLEYLRTQYPQAEFFFIVGEDSFFSMENWVEPQRIFANCTVLVARRSKVGAEPGKNRQENEGEKSCDRQANGSRPREINGTEDALEQKAEELKIRFGAKTMLLQFPQIDISSTQIRERVKAQKSIRYMVRDSVKEYIEQTHLYKD